MGMSRCDEPGIGVACFSCDPGLPVVDRYRMSVAGEIPGSGDADDAGTEYGDTQTDSPPSARRRTVRPDAAGRGDYTGGSGERPRPRAEAGDAKGLKTG